MCQLKILHQNEIGFIAMCKHCQQIQLAFGTAAIILEKKEFLDFKRDITQQQNIMEDGEMLIPENQKFYYFQTPIRKVHFALSKIELQKLIDLMEQANLLLEVETLICEHQN